MRPWALSDAPALREAIDEDVGHLKPWLSWTLEEPMTLERTRQRLEGWVQAFQAGEGFRYAVAALERPTRILGGANLNCRVGPKAHDVGWWVRRSAVGQGVAGAAVSALVVHAFEERRVERLVSQCDVENDASAAFSRALGFQDVGEVTAAYPDGTPRPVLRFELTRESYGAGVAEPMRARARRVRLADGRSGPP